MDEYIIPSSPNWYCSRISDLGSNGVYVYGSRGSIVFWKIDRANSARNSPFKYSGCIRGHYDKVSAISLSPDSTYLCSGGEDGKVKVWLVDSMSLVQEHDCHSKIKLTAIDWSIANKDLVVSGDMKGKIVTWDIRKKNTVCYTPEQAYIFCLTCSPHNSDMVAIGYRQGLILLVNIEDSSVIHRLRGHDEEVHCLAWCPVAGENILVTNTDTDEENGRGSLLASGSRDRTIRVWSTMIGKCLSVNRLPSSIGHKKEKYMDKKTRIWLTLHWPRARPQQIVSGSHSGELLMWDLTQTGGRNWKQLSGYGHNRIVFNIAGGGVNHNTLCSISMDRQIILWDLEGQESINVLPSLGGFVYNLAASSLDPSRLAIGVGDNMVRIWNTANSRNDYDIVSLWQGFNAKVTTLCWNPTKEGQFAYGTDDGRVGIYNLLGNSPPIISNTYHKKTVYVVTWGPRCSDGVSEDKSTECIFSVGDGVILQHDSSKLKKDAVKINDIITKTNGAKGSYPFRSEISWKLDFTVVAIGNDDGSIELYQPPTLKHICTIQVHTKLINCIRWHPAYVGSQNYLSKLHSWLASGSNENVVHVIEVQNVLENISSITTPMRIADSVCSLEGHSHRVTSLCWSPHVEGMLASVSYDGTAQVWNVLKQEPVANFRGHHGRLLSVQWSLLDADYIYTGGDDYTAFRWKISQQTYTRPPEPRNNKSKNRGRGRKTQLGSSETADSVPDQNKVSIDVDIGATGILEEKKQELQKAADEYLSTPENKSPRNEMTANVTASKNSEKDGKSKIKRKAKSLFPLSATLENRGKLQLQEDCLKMAHILYDDVYEGQDYLDEDYCHLGLYINRATTFNFLKSEGLHHKNHDNFEYYCHLEILKGNICEVLEEATQRRELNDWLVSMAPLASYNTWLDICVKYAKQLVENGLYSKAASYYLSAHCVYEAIDMLLKNEQYKEAATIAKSRLSPMDPKLKDVFYAWGNRQSADGHYEMAAKCFISINEPRIAAKMLTRRTDPVSLIFATELSLLSNEVDSGKLYAQMYMQQALARNDWKSILTYTRKYESLQAFSMVTIVHMEMVLMLKELNLYQIDKYHNVDDLHSKDRSIVFMLNNEDQNDLIPWQPAAINGQSFIHHILIIWLQDIGVSLESGSLEELLTEIHVLQQSRQTSSSVQQLLIQISVDICLIALSLLLKKTQSAASHFVKAMKNCEDSQEDDIMIGLTMLVLPVGPDHFETLQQEVTAMKVMKTVSTSGTIQRTLSFDSEPLLSTGKDKATTTDDYGSSFSTPASTLCTVLDSVKAFCYYAALKYLLKDSSSLKTDERVALDDQPITEHEDTRIDKIHNEDRTTSDTVISENTLPNNIPNKDNRRDNLLISDQVKSYFKALLWDDHGRLTFLKETLQAIGNAVNTLIHKHKLLSETTVPDHSVTATATTEHAQVEDRIDPYDTAFIDQSKKNSSSTHISSDTSTVAMEMTDQKEDTPKVNEDTNELSPRCVKSGRLSDMSDYVPYSPLNKSIGDPTVFEKSSNDVSVVSKQSVDLEIQMNLLPLKKRPKLRGHIPLSRKTSDMSEYVSMTAPATKLLTDLTVPGCIEKQTEPENQDASTSTDNINVNGTVSITESELPVHYEAIPKEWYTMPASTKYTAEYVTLSILTDEQQRIDGSLDSIPDDVKKSVFPNCKESAGILKKVAECHCDSELLNTVCVLIDDWLNKYQS